MTALLDAADAAEEIADDFDATETTQGFVDATSLRLLAKHARESAAELDAWKRLAMVYKVSMYKPSVDAFAREGQAQDALRALSIDPATGKRIDGTVELTPDETRLLYRPRLSADYCPCPDAVAPQADIQMTTDEPR